MYRATAQAATAAASAAAAACVRACVSGDGSMCGGGVVLFFVVVNRKGFRLCNGRVGCAQACCGSVLLLQYLWLFVLLTLCCVPTSATFRPSFSKSDACSKKYDDGLVQ